MRTTSKLSDAIRAGSPSASAAPFARFSGTLADLTVADWLQFLQVLRKSAVIVVNANGAESTLWCCEGAILDAESGRLRGEAAVHRIVGLEQGGIDVELRPVTRPRSVCVPTQQLLLEAARRRDESAAWRRKLGDGERYQLCQRPSAQQSAGLAPAEQRLLMRFVSASSLEQVLELSELGELETLLAVQRWLEAGTLVAAGPEPSNLRPTAPGPSVPPLASNVLPRPLPAQRTAVQPGVWAGLAVLLSFVVGFWLRGAPGPSERSEAAAAANPASATAAAGAAAPASGVVPAALPAAPPGDAPELQPPGAGKTEGAERLEGDGKLQADSEGVGVVVPEHGLSDAAAADKAPVENVPAEREVRVPVPIAPVLLTAPAARRMRPARPTPLRETRAAAGSASPRSASPRSAAVRVRTRRVSEPRVRIIGATEPSVRVLE